MYSYHNTLIHNTSHPSSQYIARLIYFAWFFPRDTCHPSGRLGSASCNENTSPIPRNDFINSVEKEKRKRKRLFHLTIQKKRTEGRKDQFLYKVQREKYIYKGIWTDLGINESSWSHERHFQSCACVHVWGQEEGAAPIPLETIYS